MSSLDTNLHMLEVVADGLKDLLPQMTFVGGATTALYLPEAKGREATEVRPTDDVDCVIPLLKGAAKCGSGLILNSLAHSDDLKN